MRRRALDADAAGIPVGPFTRTPVSGDTADVRQTWAAYRAWRRDFDRWALAHPEDADALWAIESASTIPDSPWDPSAL